MDQDRGAGIERGLARLGVVHGTLDGPARHGRPSSFHRLSMNSRRKRAWSAPLRERRAIGQRAPASRRSVDTMISICDPTGSPSELSGRPSRSCNIARRDTSARSTSTYPYPAPSRRVSSSWSKGECPINPSGIATFSTASPPSAVVASRRRHCFLRRSPGPRGSPTPPPGPRRSGPTRRASADPRRRRPPPCCVPRRVCRCSRSPAQRAAPVVRVRPRSWCLSVLERMLSVFNCVALDRGGCQVLDREQGGRVREGI